MGSLDDHAQILNKIRLRWWHLAGVLTRSMPT
jgi:hypothetical protein